MENEMNFWDLCVAFGRAIGRGCVAGWRLLTHMLRMSYRYWWIVLTIIILAIAGALYFTRDENLNYRANAVAMINGASVSQFEQAFAPLRSGRMLPVEAEIAPYVFSHTATTFTTYRVVDCLEDGVADYIDFKRKSSPTDTVNIQMQDRLCIQFRIKVRDMYQLPQIEKALLDFLNANPALQQSYGVYLENLRNEVAFNHSQAHKLDSLTSSYYFYTASNAQPKQNESSGVNFYGDRRIRLFLDEIYKQQKHVQQGDYRLQLATAPVVLENHFSIDPRPVNGRLKCVVLFFLLGWIAACVFAELIDKRKAIIAWLKA